MCFIAMTTGYTFSVTEKNSMERLYGILPVKKSEMVMGRYFFCCCAWSYRFGGVPYHTADCITGIGRNR